MYLFPVEIYLPIMMKSDLLFEVEVSFFFTCTRNYWIFLGLRILFIPLGMSYLVLSLREDQ